jgi:hypothetical protein
LEVSESVWDGLCEPYLILVLLKLVGKRESEVALKAFPRPRVAIQHLVVSHPMMIGSFPRYVILEVFNVLAPSKPVFPTLLLVILRENANFHAQGVEGLRLR